MSASSYTKPKIKTNFSSTPTWFYTVVVVLLYSFGLYSFLDFIFDPLNKPILDDLSDVLVTLLPLSFPFLPFIIIF
ncbi:MAG: hypothetical protein ACXACP_01185, partial [Candidatus Hodarchaeales archaeon]